MAEVPPNIGMLPTSSAPVSSRERVDLLDVLRGFALFGILLVNMALFSWPVYFLFGDVPLDLGPPDQLVNGLIEFLAAGKFYPLFSFLFGIGVAMQMQRSEERGMPFYRLHTKRMLVLLCFGMVHGFLIWEGDILMLYGLLGLVLMAFVKCNPRTFAVWIGICMVIPTIIQFALWVLIPMISVFFVDGAQLDVAIANWAYPPRALGEENLQVFANGSLSEVMLQRVKNTLYISSMAFADAPIVFAMFLAGLHAGRRGWLTNAAEHVGLLRRVVAIGLCIAIPGNLFSVVAREHTNTSWGWWWAFSVVHPWAHVTLMFVYVAAIALLFQQERWRRNMLMLAPVGRMALSNYLLQSIVCTTIFYSYGLGLYGSVGRTTGVGLAVGIFLLQIPLSSWWLKRFQFGPAEWLWRSVTYGRIQPMRRVSITSTAAF